MKRMSGEAPGSTSVEASFRSALEADSMRWDAAESLVTEKRGSAAPYRVDVERSRFPFAIVWTPLPIISWLLPFIGHMGICDSRGVVYDFAGPYYIGIDSMAFSSPTRYLVLDPSRARSGDAAQSPQQLWDAGIDTGSEAYSRRMHNICCDNCHSHVARCLNAMRYDGRTNWNMVTLAAWLLFSGRFVSFGRALQTWLPFLLIVLCIVLMRVFIQ